MSDIIRKASIDMGTNTFQLLIADVKGNVLKKLYTNDIFVRLGKGGISDGMITDDAIERAFNALDEFNDKIVEYKVTEVKIAATSAVRSAKNGEDFIKSIYQRYKFTVEILSGEKEANVIYHGVKTDTSIEDHAIIMDIGGGSVEFIIADNKEILWKQSFEIGAQRLYDKFCYEDPISDKHKNDLFIYIKEKLKPMLNQISKLNEIKFIGAAGTFQTIQEIYGAKHNCSPEEVHKVTSKEYEEMHHLFVKLSRNERFSIPGLIKERVDVIIPASLLLYSVLNLLKVNEINISSGSLREGLILL